jgi:uncharacterized membrane protein HdeD (DUF308 family)
MNETAFHPTPEIAPMEFRPRWGWFVTLGVVLLGLAAIAFIDIVAATVVSVFVVGLLMLVGAIAQVMHAFQVKRGPGFVFWLLGGLIYGVAGIAALHDPLLAAMAFTLVLAWALIVAGGLRMLVSLRLRRDHGWGWMFVSGLITAVVGVLLVAGWPLNSLVLLGALLAVDLAFQGIAAIAWGLALKAAR